LRAELDVYFARLYGLNRKQLRYILDPADLTPKEREDILNPYEEIEDPLDEEGYEVRYHMSTFPGETFRVLKDKEMRQFGEYRTRRLVLEAWERLRTVEIGNPEAYREQTAPDEPKQEVIDLSQPQSPAENDPALVQERPFAPVKSPSPVVKGDDTPSDKLPLSDFGLYKCAACGKMVLGYDKEAHVREAHEGRSVEWKKIR
jgi:hypothetical protein